jgi:peptidoglycan/LPS O-acetylase OafA/YrhL
VTLKPALSAYLDFLRFVAALAVLLGHMDQDGLYMSWMPLSGFSHEAVMVFFVLSGFIIYYSTTDRASTWQQYAIARLSRIYSVALLAVVFSTVLAILVSQRADFDATALSNYSEPSLWNAVSSLFFLNASWLNSADLTLNNPYWSLCYEVWFYVLFGAYFFTQGNVRFVLVGLAALVAGPAILVLLPIWLMGACLAASGKHDSRWKTGPAWAGFLAPLAVILLINLTQVDATIRLALHDNVPGYWRLVSSQRFVTDYLIGAVLCLHIASFSSLPLGVQTWFAAHRQMWATLAGFSFTLYLFHRPMTQLLGSWFPVARGEFVQSTLVALGILLACWMISWTTEKQLPAWRRQFSRLFVNRV